MTLHKYPRKQASSISQSSANRPFQKTVPDASSSSYISPFLSFPGLQHSHSSVPSPSLHALAIGHLMQNKSVRGFCICVSQMKDTTHPLVELVVPRAADGLDCQSLCTARVSGVYLGLKASPGVLGERPSGGHLGNVVSHTALKGPSSSRISSPPHSLVSTHKSLLITAMLQKPPATPSLILQLSNVSLSSHFRSRLN